MNRQAGRSGGRRVFISYSRRDAGVVDALADGLVRAGHDPWIDTEDIVSGSWAASIVEAIRQCDVAVVVLTESSVRSREVLKEVRLAAKRHLPLIPVVVYPPPEVPDDIEYHIVGEQRVEVDPRNLRAAVPSLVAAVEGSDTQGQRRGRRAAVRGLGCLAVVGGLAFGAATVVTGRLPPWAAAPVCPFASGEVESQPASFVTLRGAALNIVIRSTSDGQVSLPMSDGVTVTGADGFQYRREPGLVNGGWFLSESIAPRSTKALALGIATEPSRPRQDTITIRIAGVSDLPIPVLRCEIVIRGTEVEFAG